LAAVWEGRGGMRKKKKEKQRKRVSADGGICIMVFSDGITDGRISSVIPSVMPSVKEPRHLSLNPSVIPVGKIT
jgi:hypothetical protein